MKQQLTSTKLECVDVGMNWCKVLPTQTKLLYSPTTAHLTHSTMLQLAIYDQMHMCSIDTVGAFLYQEYPESLKPLYVILPKAVAEVCNLDPKTT
jgi:hypothetical protein